MPMAMVSTAMDANKGDRASRRMMCRNRMHRNTPGTCKKFVFWKNTN